MATHSHRGLDWVVEQLDARQGVIDEITARRVLSEAEFDAAQIQPYVEERPGSYSRRCVVRREAYELLVLTWAPSQGSVAHDHSGSLCGLKIVRGCLTERLFAQAPDGQVRMNAEAQFGAGEILVDPGVVVHSLCNNHDSGQLLVTVHIYSPPLPEIRRYAVADAPPASIFLRQPAENAQTIAIIGGGFTGTMTLANLLRFGNQITQPLHILLIDRLPAFGEGVAYRTNDAKHLLNVPAGRMSAWPDRPDDFLKYAQSIDPKIQATDFLPRKIYGRYVRQSVHNLAETSGNHLSAELIRDEATELAPCDDAGWSIKTAGGRSIHADLAIITIGHRPPDDPLTGRWKGPRQRFVPDPWAALVLSQIGPNEPVLLLGSGLTAVDAMLTLNRTDRVAPLFAVSRRGLLPMAHAPAPRAAADVSKLIDPWLNPETPLTVRRLVSDLRGEIEAAAAIGVDWRQIIDGLRPVTPKLWERLSVRERARFLNRIRSIWEIHRHRMAPEIAESIQRLRKNETLEIIPGSLLSASADDNGVDVTLALRGGSTRRTVRVSWVINCTGPGVHTRHTTHPILRPLIESGILHEDELSLGLRTDSQGHAVGSDGKILPTLLVAGTLRKSTLWESTAVPELRQQAQTVAQTALLNLSKNRKP